MTGAFYGGGHGTRSALDVVYWCQYAVTTYYGQDEAFIAPAAPIDGMSSTYQSLAYAFQRAGAEIDTEYRNFLKSLQDQELVIPVQQALKTRGALLLNKGTVSVSMGDERRIITEENYRLVQKYMTANVPLWQLFEYGAKLPGVLYL